MRHRLACQFSILGNPENTIGKSCPVPTRMYKGVCADVKKARVLLTNDDGYQAEGLKALAEELREIADVSIVAPSWERSGAAQSLTLRQPIV